MISDESQVLLTLVTRRIELQQVEWRLKNLLKIVGFVEKALGPHMQCQICITNEREDEILKSNALGCVQDSMACMLEQMAHPDRPCLDVDKFIHTTKHSSSVNTNTCS